ncbi:CPBP family intramembrane glutamic endopeptidase [Curtobacterium sp. YR515]|uniref:CPBP family intramembrane glutamic endopeptidase n=1 Tax=Curtobacterium sp. YR515 TaxID=1855316 RepID=UPI0008EC07A2|nr:CPBP family intramembrane glutamic endopeptidase [Curtobacterium sp. YR515]SFF50537.1 hypothetical protein SAMN05216329_1049 [Curtobacterium sp. YR515]
MEHQGTPSHLRVRPRVWIGFAVWLGYMVVVFTVQRLGGVPYTDLSRNGHDLFFGAGLSLIVASVLLAVTTTLLGWWRPALSDEHPSRHRWPITVPIALALLAVLGLTITDWAAFDGPFLAASIALLLVGFTEELTTRGLLLTALRSRFAEPMVWFLSTAAFAAMHSLNFFAGQALGPTLAQVVNTFLVGTAFYVLRRTTGSLVWSMVLHALWDFSAFSAQHGEVSPMTSLVGVLEWVIGVAALAVVWATFRGSDRSRRIAA